MSTVDRGSMTDGTNKAERKEVGSLGVQEADISIQKPRGMTKHGKDRTHFSQM